jgi:hypothetical protein
MAGAEGARFRPAPLAADARGGAPRRAAAADVEAAAAAGAGGLEALAVGRALPRLDVRAAGGAAGACGGACGSGTGAGSPALGLSAMACGLYWCVCVCVRVPATDLRHGA